MRTLLAVITFSLLGTIALAQCGFQAEPVGVMNWFRAEGWSLPGTRNAKVTPTTVSSNGEKPAWPRGLTVSLVEPRNGYQISFPQAVFKEDGKSKRVKAASFNLQRLLRWEINGRPYAYSYSLAPEGLLCVFNVDFIDETGDGVFRVMKEGSIRFSPPPLPRWALKTGS